MKQTNNFTSRTAAMLAILITMLTCGAATLAQTTAFTYQGKLTDGGAAASGTYDLGFALYDAETDGAQIGTVLTRPNVTVSGGIFTVSLDFGAAAFSGANRFLQIAVKKTTETNFTTLTPRQPLTSAPYAIQSLNATNAVNATNAAQLGGAAAGEYARNDSQAFVRNQTTQQASTNFNVSGNGVIGGRVGIGTTAAPTTVSLQVNGGILARGGAPGANGASNNGYSFSGNGGGGDSGMFSIADDTLQFYAGNEERIRLTQSIDLTAGNNTPFGGGITLRAGNGGAGPFPTGGGITLKAGNGGNGGIGGVGASITLQPGDGGQGLGGSSPSGNVILAPGSGNVGIGTTSPTSKLDVSGDLTVNGGLTVNGTINGTGQDAATVYGTGGLTVTRTDSTYRLVPGLRQTINVPENAALVISTDGGVRTLSETRDGRSVVEVAIFVDGEIMSARRHYVSNEINVFPAVVNWALSGARTLTAGSHTIEVRARSTSNSFLSNARVSSGGADEALRGQLTVTIIKK